VAVTQLPKALRLISLLAAIGLAIGLSVGIVAGVLAGFLRTVLRWTNSTKVQWELSVRSIREKVRALPENMRAGRCRLRDDLRVGGP
jgi:hypothetical protein